MDNGSHEGRLRTRLFLNGAINEDWTYTGRFENNQYYTDKELKEGKSDDDISLNWAYVSGPIGGVKADLGRQNLKLHTGNVVDAEFDAVKLAYGKDVKITGFAGKGEGEDVTPLDNDRLYAVDLSAKLGVVDAYVTYYNADNGYSQEIWNVGAALPVIEDLKLSGEWMHGDADDVDGDNNGYVVGLAYKGAKASQPGSWGVYANYYDMPALTYFDNTNDGYSGVMNDWKYGVGEGNDCVATDGFEGYEVGANVTLAKNIVAAVKYFDLDSREGDLDEQTIWSEVVFTF